jgi:hypothetical protein
LWRIKEYRAIAALRWMKSKNIGVYIKNEDDGLWAVEVYQIDDYIGPSIQELIVHHSIADAILLAHLRCLEIYHERAVEDKYLETRLKAIENGTWTGDEGDEP